MFDIGSWPTNMKLLLESADSWLELVDCSTDSSTDPVKVGMWVFIDILQSIKCFAHMHTLVNSFYHIGKHVFPIQPEGCNQLCISYCIHFILPLIPM